MFIDTRVVNATLLIMVKVTAIMSLELQNILVFLFLLEKHKKISNIQLFQTIYYKVIATLILIILIFWLLMLVNLISEGELAY